jgi:hypothetical protein
MKNLIFGLCVVVVPAFSSNTSCPQGGQLSSIVGCQTFDSMLANVSSSSSLVSPEVPAITVIPSTSTFSDLLVTPAPSTVSPAVDTVAPTISSSSMFSAPLFSQDIVIPPSTSFESLPTTSFTSGLSSSLGMGQVPLGSVILPSQFNVGLPIGIGVTPIGTSDPFTGDALGTPEASSVAMIGAGLICLSLISTAARKRKRSS